MWEEMSAMDLQAELQRLFNSNPCLRIANLHNDLAPAFSGPANSAEERACLKDTLCGLLGLITQQRDPSHPSLQDGIRFQQDVEVGDDSEGGGRACLLLIHPFVSCGSWSMIGVETRCDESMLIFNSPGFRSDSNLSQGSTNDLSALVL